MGEKDKVVCAQIKAGAARTNHQGAECQGGREENDTFHQAGGTKGAGSGTTSQGIQERFSGESPKRGAMYPPEAKEPISACDQRLADVIR